MKIPDDLTLPKRCTDASKNIVDVLVKCMEDYVDNANVEYLLHINSEMFSYSPSNTHKLSKDFPPSL